MDPPPVPEEPLARGLSALCSFFFRDISDLLTFSRRPIAERFAGEGESSMDVAPSARDWSLLPLDVLCSVFVMVGAVDVLMGAGLVCRSWREAAKLPHVWHVVDIENHSILSDVPGSVVEKIAKAAIDRSDGQLRVFAGKWCVNDELLKHIVESSPSLTTLRLISCSDVFSFAAAMRGPPLMELRSLELDFVRHTVGDLAEILENCPVLEVLRVHNCFDFSDEDEHAMRSRFDRINTIKLECDLKFYYDSDIESYESDL